MIASPPSIRVVGLLHQMLVLGRRFKVLAQRLAKQLPAGATVLDVGCGSGAISRIMLEQRPDLRIQGVEVLIRPGCKIPVEQYDGKNLPYPDSSFDVCMCIDVLHHTEDAAAALRELTRVSRRFVLIKDHLSENRLDFLTLKAMDWVGNRPQGVVLPYRYQSHDVWKQQFEQLGLKKVSWDETLPLYPIPIHWVLGRRLHFIALLEKNNEQ